ncbi:sporulation protein [Streptomyces boncukensis]|uniref:Sporulation protein n=1 Tax=Streptomyces boncukensis TaxID=2711219 RepID=A0A6G4X7Y2_9ACTN|nr:sporulation protein [Streptomyces boncukensis]NGO73659.1 sporulation protein [Streptomyces boncukensis]
MAFKKLFASVGVGGASVDTVLYEEQVEPGGVARGEVRIEGGSVTQEVQGLSVGLQAKVEVETDDGEHKRNIEFARRQLGGELTLQEGATFAVPFELEIPWETPVTAVDGQPLRGMQLGVSTELAIARAVDSTDLDPLHIHPLPAQQAILDAFIGLGFRFKSADMEKGRIRGTRQQLPFYQEIEFHAAPQYRGLSQVELSFVADAGGMDVVLEMDKKPGLFSEGSDTFRAFPVDFGTFADTDWEGYLHEWLSEVGGKRGWF